MPTAMDSRVMMKASGGGLPVEAGEHSVGASVRVAWELVSDEAAE